MKKLFALVALVLGVVSCQTDPNDLDVVVGGEREVMLNVSLPEATRANSANGFQIADLGSTYDLRYILEVYRAVDENNISYEQCQRQVKLADAATMSFPVRLAPHYNYQIVVWADIVDNGSYNDRIYKTDNGLDAIEILSWNAMDETRDAYTGTKYIADFSSSSSDLSMVLTRPFAKVRVVATDINDITALGLSPKAAKVSYSQAMYTKYNAVTDEASAAEAKSHQYTTFPYEDAVGEKTLFADYVFVPESGTAKFTLEVYDDEAATTRLIKENSFSTDIFVERNKITTIKGDVLTEGGNVSVKVENDLGEKVTINVVDTAESLMEQFEQLEDPDVDELNIELGGDIDLNDLLSAGILSTRAAEPSYGLIIPAGKSLVLDLKGFTISQSKAQSGKYAMIENNGTLTICNSANTNGVISYGDTAILTADVGYASNTIQNNGTLTINEGVTLLNTSGTAVATYGYPHVIDTNGKLTINGGVLTNEANYSTMRIWTSNTDSEKCVVTIEGGTFNGCIDFQAHNNNYPTIPHYGTLTVNGGTFNPDTFTKSAIRVLRFAVNAEDMHATINDGNFNGKILVRNFGTFTETPKIFDICGGTFNTAAKEGTDEALINDDYQFDQNGEYWVVEKKPVIAKIGEVEYRTLQKAFDAVELGANTIVLVDDVNVNAAVVLAEGKTATLDLNGKTLTATGYAIENNGTLTITGDGTINGVVYGENGTTTVENGTFNPADGGAYVFLNSTAGTLIINGGTINTGSSYPVYSYNENNKLIINDVIINGKFGCVNAYGTNGSVEINGGTFQMTGVQGNTSHITYFSSNIVATINGGTFEKIGNISMSATGGGGICANGGANLTINGGTFAGDHDDVYNYGGTISVKGGEYKFKPDFVADGYGAVEKNGRWTVAKAYDITEEGYTILTAPGMFWFANEVNSGANYFEGKTIKLGADIDLNNAEWTPIGSAYKDHGFMGNFDGNGKIIKNLKITALTPDSDQFVYGGLFGVTEGVDKDNQNYIKNLVIENVNIDLDGDIVAAAVAYPYYTALENIKVKGNVNIKGGKYTSGVLAYTRRCVDAKNISIEANAGSVIEGTQTVGGVISDIQTNGGLTANYSNFKAENLTIKGTQSVGGISGIIAAQNLDGATVKNVTIVSDDTRKGTISGSFDGVCTIKDAVVENVTGADNYVGCLYSGTASDTSSVTINGDVYTYNNGWIVNGN